MFLQILKLWKTFSTQIADVRFDFVVDMFKVPFDQIFPVKRFSALITSVNFLFSVNRITVIPVLTICEGFVAFLAVTVLGSVMN